MQTHGWHKIKIAFYYSFFVPLGKFSKLVLSFQVTFLYYDVTEEWMVGLKTNLREDAAWFAPSECRNLYSVSQR